MEAQIGRVNSSRSSHKRVVNNSVVSVAEPTPPSGINGAFELRDGVELRDFSPTEVRYGDKLEKRDSVFGLHLARCNGLPLFLSQGSGSSRYSREFRYR